MEALFLLLAFPVAWPFIAKRIWDTTINYQEMFISIVVVALILVGVWQAGKWSQTSDTEVWNGQVTKKERNHGHYTTSYCCGTDKDGNCNNTCYTDHYTVDWIARTTVGDVTLKALDKTSRSVYNTPDPKQYTNCKIGEPASLEHEYVNYVQAVPSSLFNDTSKVSEQFADKIPTYPKVHHWYKYNRVINYSLTDTSIRTTLNTELNNTLRKLGAAKQVNIIVILVEESDPTYRYAVENAWLGGEKNDVVVFIGLERENIIWTDVMTWALNSGNELFHVTLRDKLNALKTVDDPVLVASTITDTISSTYDRPHMKDYEYLAEEVTPATWVIILSIILSIVLPLGASYFFHVKEVDFFRKKGYSRYR